MATRAEIQAAILANLPTNGTPKIRAVNHRSVLNTFSDSVCFRLRGVSISGTTYQNDALIDSPGVDVLGSGLNDVAYTFDSDTGTITFPFSVTATNVTIFY